MLHEYAHSHGGKARRILAEPTPEQWRVVLPGHNSIAWIVWHIARGEDWAVNTMLRGDEQLLTRNGWDARMGEPRRDFGAGMTPDEMAEVSARVDVGALRGYYEAVTAETRHFVQDEFDFDTMNEPIDLPGRLALAPEAPGPSQLMQRIVGAMTTSRQWPNTFTIVDVLHHFDEADHVFRLLLPDRPFP
jgi:DinB superfamily